MTVEKIKKLFDNYMDQVLKGMLDDPRDFFVDSFESAMNSNDHNMIDVVLYDLYDENKNHYGLVCLEVKYDNEGRVLDVYQWAQLYGVIPAVEFTNLEDCIYSMIAKRDSFNERHTFNIIEHE